MFVNKKNKLKIYKVEKCKSSMKTIKVDEIIWEELLKEKLNNRMNKIADVINDNLKLSKKFNNEEEFRRWFKKNFMIFGFSKIIEERKNKAGSPDFIMESNNKPIGVELETLSSHFIDHKHKKEEIDLVICLVNNRKLPVKTIELMNFEFNKKYYDVTSIRISKKLKKELRKLEVHSRETDEQIIIRLIKHFDMRNILDK